uniref:Secreted protein n=1 Tax=Populus davidiana TaxID=266767 RepID=A0A6M2ECW2_9ROSI
MCCGNSNSSKLAKKSRLCACLLCLVLRRFRSSNSGEWDCLCQLTGPLTSLGLETNRFRSQAPASTDSIVSSSISASSHSSSSSSSSSSSRSSEFHWWRPACIGSMSVSLSKLLPSSA